jgi:hypothetical protein
LKIISTNKIPTTKTPKPNKNHVNCLGIVLAAVAFQSTFHSKIHQNNIFYYLKIIFDISILKLFKNSKKN